eukprot:2902085-Pyramimonas_sp.AAC.1
MMGATRRNENVLGDRSRADVVEANYTAILMGTFYLPWLQERGAHWISEQPMDSYFYKHPAMASITSCIRSPSLSPMGAKEYHRGHRRMEGAQDFRMQVARRKRPPKIYP